MKWGMNSWTPGLGWEVNHRSIHEDESVKTWVSFVIDCCKPNWDNIASILEPS